MSRISTYELLASLGFVKDERVISDPPGGLSFDFGNILLTASFLQSITEGPQVVLNGLITTKRTVTEVLYHLPHEIDSREMGIALIVYCLDSHTEGGVFLSKRPVEWLEIGRTNKHLLPWERERVAYEARPHCLVRRDYARVMLRHFRGILESVAGESVVTFGFDGEVFSAWIAGERLAVPANGEPWSERFTIASSHLRRLPKRLMHEEIVFDVWNESLGIGSWRYRGVNESRELQIEMAEKASEAGS